LTAVLGINAVFHDSAAALVVDGETVAAVEEERLSRLANPSRAFSANPKEAPA
jgi:carbamoyltransferase